MYYMFGFIMLAFLVLLVVCAQTSILLCYFHLCSEDYRWWWRSFFSTGTTGFYLFLFAIYYFVYKTTITGFLSYILYFGYTFIVVFLFSLMTGKEGGGERREGGGEGRGGVEREGGRDGEGGGGGGEAWREGPSNLPVLPPYRFYWIHFLSSVCEEDLLHHKDRLN